MKTILEFKQEVLGLAYFYKTMKSEYTKRIETIDGNYTKIVMTTKEDMTEFEKMILSEYEENEIDYKPSLTGDLF